MDVCCLEAEAAVSLREEEVGEGDRVHKGCWVILHRQHGWPTRCCPVLDVWESSCCVAKHLCISFLSFNKVRPCKRSLKTEHSGKNYTIGPSECCHGSSCTREQIRRTAPTGEVDKVKCVKSGRPFLRSRWICHREEPVAQSLSYRSADSSESSPTPTHSSHGLSAHLLSFSSGLEGVLRFSGGNTSFVSLRREPHSS